MPVPSASVVRSPPNKTMADANPMDASTLGQHASSGFGAVILLRPFPYYVVGPVRPDVGRGAIAAVLR